MGKKKSVFFLGLKGYVGILFGWIKSQSKDSLRVFTSFSLNGLSGWLHIEPSPHIALPPQDSERKWRPWAIIVGLRKEQEN